MTRTARSAVVRREVEPTTLTVVLSPRSTAPELAALGDRLRARGTDARIEGERSRIVIPRATIDVGPAAVPESVLEVLAHDLDETERAGLWAARVAVHLSFTLAPPWLDDYHGWLRLLDGLVPDGLAVHDDGSGSWRPRSWLARAARSAASPAPESLFTIHAVRGDAGGGARELLWLHTHGLARCGVPELEVLDAPRVGVPLLGQLLNRAAAFGIEAGLPSAGVPFEVGQDLALVWLPWQAALRHVPRTGLGRTADRDDVHGGRTAVLFVPRRRRLGLFGPRWQSPVGLLPLLEGEPLFWISRTETQRMALLASERFGEFRALCMRHAGTDGWRFLVKLGYTVDGAEDDPERSSEHLWFDVHAVDGARVDATLLNDPHAIERMKAGQRDWHAIDQLSDWSVHTPWGTFDPGRIDALLRRLA